MTFAKRCLCDLRLIFRDREDDNIDFFLPNVTGLIHIGANRGQERDSYAFHSLQVLWVEALPDAFARLTAHIAGFSGQRALQGLIVDQNGKEVVFNISDNEGQASSMFPFGRVQELWEDIQMVSTINLTGTTLKTLLSNEKIDPSGYDALVLDTQGSELLVLKGAGVLLDGFRFIKTEAADFDAYAGACTLNDLDSYLIDRGFTRVLTVPMKSSPGVGTYYDAVYCKKGIAGWRLRFAAKRLRRLLGRIYRRIKPKQG